MKRKWFIVVLILLSVGSCVWFLFFRTTPLKIVITYHKPHELSYNLIKNRDFMVPIQVGRAVEKEPFSGGNLNDDDIKWLHTRMIGDDTGDNISVKNREFDVLTAYYWVWKNYRKIGNPQYIGFFAHRKWLSLIRGSSDISPGFKFEDVIEYNQLLDTLNKYQIVYTINTVVYSKEPLHPIPLYTAFSMSHQIKDLDSMLSIIERYYPQLYEIAKEIMLDEQNLYGAWNFWIMKKELAFDYFEKLFHVMNELEKQIGEDVRARDYYQRRAFGYLAERFFAVWLEYQKRQNGIEPYQAFDFSFD